MNVTTDVLFRELSGDEIGRLLRLLVPNWPGAPEPRRPYSLGSNQYKTRLSVPGTDEVLVFHSEQITETAERRAMTLLREEQVR